MVLRTHKLGEADRIITLLSRTHGKIRAVARGVRRTSSKFGGRLEPFSHIDRNTLAKVAEPRPNPSARIAAGKATLAEAHGFTSIGAGRPGA